MEMALIFSCPLSTEGSPLYNEWLLQRSKSVLLECVLMSVMLYLNLYLCYSWVNLTKNFPKS